MELITIPALVIRESDYGENDKLLTLLTNEKGALTAIVKGGKSLRNKNSACSQLLCYSEFTLKERNCFYTVNEASLIEQFFEIRRDMASFALAQYVADVSSAVSVENESGAEMLSLALNTLYMICKGEKNLDFIKAVFELRCASISGLCPDIKSCRYCGRPDHEIYYLDVMNGSVACGNCFGGDEDTADREISGTTALIIPLALSVREAMHYITNANPKRIFSFSLSSEDENELFRVCEKYLTNQLGRGFKTLDFYNRVKTM